MEIKYLGHSSFLIKTKTAKIVTDPFDPEMVGLKFPKTEADIVTVSHQHKDHNNIKAVKGEPFLVEGPGEYEVKGVFIQGIPSFHDDVNGKERGPNTIYIIEAEEMRFCHLGDLGQKLLTDEQVDKIGAVDVLMVPVGGEYTIDSASAQKIIGQIDPKIVIPMHFSLPKSKSKLDDVSKFLKAMGKPSIAPVDKLTVKSSILPKEGAMEIVVLQP